MFSINNYLRGIYDARYFWLHLVRADLVFKYRRSFFGLLWTLLQPLLLTILFGIVYGAIFHSPFLQFAPFVYSGMIIWDYVIQSFMTGSFCMINAASYIMQVNHPVAIYSIKQALVCTANFAIAAIGLLIWCFAMYPDHILISLISLPIALIFYIALSWGIATISSLITIKFRDFNQFLALILQAIWFVSPVYFEPKVFIAGGLPGLVYYNPVTHLLNLVRKPLLEGCFPSSSDFIFCIALILFFGIIAVYKLKKEESDLIFYL